MEPPPLGEAGTVKCPIQIHVDRAQPVRRRNLLGACGRTRNAGVVHQNVKPAERLCCLPECRLQIVPVSHVGARSRNPVALAGHLRQCRFIHVANMHACTGLQEAVGDSAPDASRARRNEDSLACDSLHFRSLVKPPKTVENCRLFAARQGYPYEPWGRKPRTRRSLSSAPS